MKTEIESYTRVIPRDFFNEAKLLKCFGQLALKILDGLTPDNMDIYIEESGEPFNIDLTDDGSLIISNYETMINNIPVIFKTTYNSKANYPFFCEVDYTDYEVFDDNGNFTDEFKNLSLVILLHNIHKNKKS